MGFAILRGLPGLLTIVTLMLAIIYIPLMIQTYSKTYEIMKWMKNVSLDDEHKRTNHVIGDELCLSIIIIVFLATVAWLVVILYDLLEDTKRRKRLDWGFHLCAGLVLLAMAGLWFWSLYQRAVSMGKIDNSSSTRLRKSLKSSTKNFDKYGYNNMIFYDRDDYPGRIEYIIKNLLAGMEETSSFHVGFTLRRLHLYDSAKFIKIIIAEILLLINVGVYMTIFIMLFFKKSKQIIHASRNHMLYFIPCMFRKRTGLLKLLTVILGFVSLILTGTSYAVRPSYHHRPYKRVIFRETYSSIQEEFVVVMVGIFMVLSIAWLIIFWKGYMQQSSFRRKIDRWFHVVSGCLLICLAAIWFVSISLRTFSYSTYMSDSNTLADAKTRVGFQNIIVLKTSMKRLYHIRMFEHTYDDEKFAHVMIAGILILLNGGVYLYVGLLYIWIKYGRMRDIRVIHPDPVYYLDDKIGSGEIH